MNNTSMNFNMDKMFDREHPVTSEYDEITLSK